MSSGCSTWTPTPISFAGVGGSINDPSNTTVRTAIAMRLHPSLFDASACPAPQGDICTKDAISCEQTVCNEQVDPEAGLFTSQTWRGDIIALLLDSPLPANLVGKVLVHKSYEDPSKGLIADGAGPGYPNNAFWSYIEKPNVTIVGYGRNNFPGIRAYGIMRWVDFRFSSDRFNWSLGWKSCYERDEFERVPQIVLDANGYNFPFPPSPPYAPGLDCDFWQPLTNFPDANGYVLTGGGDSGGPVVLGGTTLGKSGLKPTPSPFINDPDPIIFGIASTGGCSYSHYAPTYTLETSKWISELVTDSDKDGLPDPFDNCSIPPGLPPSIANVDTDMDGTPDICDPCPMEPAPLGALKSDADSDGVCASLDNCKGTFNPTQQNDNLDAEDKHGAEILGNACEPVPVPNFYTEFSTETVNCKTVGPVQECEVITKINPGNGLRADLQGSRNNAGALKATPVPATEVRFCWNKDVPGSINCIGKIAIEDDFKNESLQDEVLETPFHRLRINEQPRTSSNLGLKTYSLGLREPVAWDFLADLNYWAAQGYPNTALPALQETRFGRLWMHASSEVGMQIDFSTGIHLKTNGLPGEQLANHYEVLYPIARQTVVNAPSAPQNSLENLECWGGECLVSKVLPPDECFACDLIHPGDIVSRPGEWRMVTELPGRGLHYLAEAGGFLPLPEPAMTPAIRDLFQSGAPRLASAEPLRGRGYGTSIPSLLFLQTDGVTIQEGLTVLGGKASTTAEARTRLLEAGGGRTGVPGFPTIESFPSLTLPPLSAPLPTPRVEGSKATIYSTTLGFVFLLRGQDKPNQPEADLWFQSVRDGSGYHAIPLTANIGRVLSATFTPVDRKLWVLDELKGKWGFSKVRLLSIDPVSGVVKEHASWPNLGVFEQRWLLTDQDGNLLLASSSSALRKHTLTRIEVKGHPTVRSHLRREGKLANQPIVEPAGYRFLIEKKSKKDKLLKIERLQSLPEKTHSFQELGSCF
jgi:hypothetical protein